MKYQLSAMAFAILFLMSCKSRPAPVTNPSTIDPVVMERLWKSIDSLEQKGLATSALEEVRKIKQLALTGSESTNLIKATLYENRYLTQLEEDSAIKALERGESELESFPEPAKSVMHSLLARWYTIYLQTHLWELKNRTEFGGAPGPDIRTWGIRHFTDKIHSHYAQSVQWTGLKTADVKAYLPLLTEEKNTDDLRPTLYDILMHRALDFFAGTESYLTKPAYDFVLTDPNAFNPAKSFATRDFSSADSTSSTWLAPVSYTHLDVYKRQEVLPAPEGC